MTYEELVSEVSTWHPLYACLLRDATCLSLDDDKLVIRAGSAPDYKTLMRFAPRLVDVISYTDSAPTEIEICPPEGERVALRREDLLPLEHKTYTFKQASIDIGLAVALLCLAGWVMSCLGG